MAVVLSVEWDNAKDESRYNKYGEWSRSGHTRVFWEKKLEEGIVKNMSQWADNTGYIIFWAEFENMEAFAKLWSDEEFHKSWLEINPLVDNLRFRILRPSVTIPDE